MMAKTGFDQFSCPSAPMACLVSAALTRPMRQTRPKPQRIEQDNGQDATVETETPEPNSPVLLVF